MIAVLVWCDGFGNDSAVIGVASSVLSAQQTFASEYNGHETRYQEIAINKIQYFDWYDAIPLFDRYEKNRKSRKRK